MRALGIFVFVVVLATAISGVAAEPPVAIGVWAMEGAQAAEQSWGPTLDYLREAIPNREFKLVPLDHAQLVGQVQHNDLDFVIVDPALYVQMESRYGIENLAMAQYRFKGSDYALSAGTLFCLSKRADLTRPADLKGRSLAAVSENSVQDWLSILREFIAYGQDPRGSVGGVLFPGTADAVAAAVLSGNVDAGCVRAGALEQLAAEQKLNMADIKVLAFPAAAIPGAQRPLPVAASTRLYAGWTLAACPKAAPDLVKTVAASLLTMSGRFPEVVGRPNLVGWTSPHSNVSVHELMQSLRMPPYEHFGDISFVAVVRQYMYWFIGLGAFVIVLTIITLYVTALNRALAAEIVERKRVEAALRESVTRFEHIASCSADWIWETDENGVFTYSSSIVESMLGYKPDEVIGRHQFELFATAEKDRMRAVGRAMLGTGARVFRERLRLLTKDGRVTIHECTAEPIRDGKGRLSGYRGVNRDITNQVRFVRL